MLGAPWPDLTSEEVVAQFVDYLTLSERQEILDRIGITVITPRPPRIGGAFFY